MQKGSYIILHKNKNVIIITILLITIIIIINMIKTIAEKEKKNVPRFELEVVFYPRLVLDGKMKNRSMCTRLQFAHTIQRPSWSAVKP